MQLRQAEQLEHHLAAEAIRLREQANKLPPGVERDLILRQARQAETGSHMSEWLQSSGLRPPD